MYKDVDGNWTRVGATILEPLSTGTGHSSDARAEVSLSGDGSKLAIVNVKAKRGSGISTGIVKMYFHSLDNTQTDWISEGDVYTDDAGGGGENVGLKISLNSDGSRLAVGVRYHDDILQEDKTLERLSSTQSLVLLAQSLLKFMIPLLVTMQGVVS